MTSTDFRKGERVRVSGYSHGDGTFLEYGDPKHACPPTHLTYPGMRIAYVEFDRYGRQPVWENKITPLRLARQLEAGSADSRGRLAKPYRRAAGWRSRRVRFPTGRM